MSRDRPGAGASVVTAECAREPVLEGVGGNPEGLQNGAVFPHAPRSAGELPTGRR